MNLLFLVEGEKAETTIYKGWLSHIFPDFRYVVRPEDTQGNSYRIITGYGYPSMLYSSKLYGISRLEACLLDIKQYQDINHFFICIDSEEESYESRFNEIQKKLAEFRERLQLEDCPETNFHIVIQHCCIETWALGNNQLSEVYKNAENSIFLKLQEYYDVGVYDPEQMDRISDENYTNLLCSTKAKFHKKYLKEYFKNFNIPSSSKRQPDFIAQVHYLNSLQQRCQTTNHLSSFQNFFQILNEIRNQSNH